MDTMQGSNARVINLSAMAICVMASSCNVLWRWGPQVLGESDRNRKSLSRAASQRYAQFIDIMHTHLGAGAMVQPFFFCASTHSNHSIEPGWGTV